MSLTMESTYKLANGVKIPYLGFGVFQVKEASECEESILAAIRNGYHSIDTATRYANEEFVGNALKKSSVSREELFITTKVWVTDFGYEKTKAAFFDSLKKMQLEYIDLYLIHWPAPGYEQAWKAMEELYKEGYVKAIGVCNFQIKHFEKLQETATIMPMINQIETHPYFQQDELRTYMEKHNIAHEAWGPLGQGVGGLFDNPVLLEIANTYNKSTAQVMLRWHLQRNTIIIPKSVREERIIENANIFDFELSTEDLEQIATLNKETPNQYDANDDEWLASLLSI